MQQRDVMGGADVVGSRGVVGVAQVFLLACLCTDFALGIDGELQGLTRAEMARAWRARYQSELPRRAVNRLSEDLQIDLLPKRRQCAVSGHHRRPWAPVAMMVDGRIGA